MYSRQLSGILLRRLHSNISNDSTKNIYLSKNHNSSITMRGSLKWYRHKMNVWLREQSILVFKACTRQCEFIAAQRIRRSMQIFHLYSRIWDEVKLKEFLRIWKYRVSKHSKDFLLGATGITLYNWDKERIPDNEIHSYYEEIEQIHKLRDLTVTCNDCNSRLAIDSNQEGVKYCQCNKSKYVQNVKTEDVDWIPFIERQDMLVWRKKDETTGLYTYKVYGSFSDVSANDFLQVQIDIDYRREWDATAKELKIIDSDAKLINESLISHCDVIYWEMVWPRLFANRDYVYQRRWLYDKENNIIVIVSKGTDHPNAPNRTDTYRVTSYWSYMVIKPYTNFHESGIEFGLTYFDDPGVNIPSAVTTWVAMSGLPDYLSRMRQAGKDYKEYKLLNKSKESLTILSTELNVDEETEDTSNSDKENENLEENFKLSPDKLNKNDEKHKKPPKSPKSKPPGKSGNTENENENNIEDDINSQDKGRGFFDFLLFSKLFA